MPRPTLWTAIADALRRDVAGGRYGPGDRLPTEAELSRRFGVNRHTLRRALAALSADGTLRTRRGSGIYVTDRPVLYPLGRRVRFHQALAAQGQTADRRLLLLETRRADARERAALDLPDGAEVHVYDGVSLAGGAPVALFRSAFPAARLPRMKEALQAAPSITQALAAHGIADFTRAETRLTAKRAGPAQALHLGLKEGDPILRSVSINVDAEGRPVEYGRTWFAGDRITLTVTPD